MSFKDHFSGHAASYADARPSYPDELFSFLRAQCAAHDLVWDCATGNGQAAVSLAAIFKHVVATDASGEQIQQARQLPNIEYRQVAAETVFLEPESCNLVTVAQALHWFDTDAFFANVAHCLKPGGVIAAWCYGPHQINDDVDKLVHRLYEDVLGDYWPPERRLVERQYRDIQFPFDTCFEQQFQMSRQWNLQQLCNYITSWSALQRYMAAQGDNPLHLIYDELVAAWGGDSGVAIELSWPLIVKLAKK